MTWQGQRPVPRSDAHASLSPECQHVRDCFRHSSHTARSVSAGVQGLLFLQGCDWEAPPSHRLLIKSCTILHFSLLSSVRTPFVPRNLMDRSQHCFPVARQQHSPKRCLLDRDVGVGWRDPLFFPRPAGLGPLSFGSVDALSGFDVHP